ncbi:hypothetical protein JAAARDRAFT_40722 [Jaapia argillacea MUCL 33604]|uniref:ferric-chelate reductase (NADPH) n=1 Tax=Jaapia argillacea MUCL 33604 TaxID=933084 RepID=A0A067PAF4_9AGAM|nr:hypothetical protein JAAARDRAFT_40722 [Jaapia argillacea MUCL 33604]
MSHLHEKDEVFAAAPVLPGVHRSTVDQDQLVFHLDIFLLAVLAFFTVITLPRVFTRFSRASEWTQGLFLYYAKLEAPPRPRRRPTQIRNAATVAARFGSDDAPMPDAHAHIPRRQIEGKRRSIAASLRTSFFFPPHMPALSTTAPTFARILRYPITDLTLGQIVLLTIYFSLLVYASLYKSSLFTDPLRAGFVAMSQIPVVVVLATKVNVIGILTEYGYHKLNYLHRYAGAFLAIAANIHTLGYVYQWTLEGVFYEKLQTNHVVWGFTATACCDVLAILSTAFWREKAYNLFLTSHLIAFPIFLVACCLHQPGMTPYVLAAVGFYGFDILMRLVRTRIVTATIHPVPELGLTRVEVPSLNAGWRTGQHIRLRILSIYGMGWWGSTEIHPFTIANVEKTPEGMVLMCKKVGDWTEKLFEMAKVAEYGEGGAGAGREVTVMLEGPYGGPGHSVFASYSGAMFVAGGSGITAAVSAVQELIRKDIDGLSRVKVIELVWVVQTHASLTPLLPVFTSLLEQSTMTTLRIDVYYTRAAPSEVGKMELPAGLSLSAGRPKIAKLLEAVLDCTLSITFGSKTSRGCLAGIAVAVCGPPGLGEDVRQVVGSVDPRRRNAVRGVELHEEAFGW